MQEIVQNLDGGLAGREYILDQLHRAAADGHRGGLGIRIFDLTHQEIQTRMHHIQRRPEGCDSRNNEEWDTDR